MRAQILNSSESLNYMQILPCASLKNIYFYQILIILAHLPTRAYTCMIKKVPRGFNIFTRNIKDVMFLFLHVFYFISNTIFGFRLELLSGFLVSTSKLLMNSLA